MTDVMTVPAKCPECATKLEPHCEKLACGWWQCPKCKLFGDSQGRQTRMP